MSVGYKKGGTRHVAAEWDQRRRYVADGERTGPQEIEPAGLCGDFLDAPGGQQAGGFGLRQVPLCFYRQERHSDRGLTAPALYIDNQDTKRKEDFMPAPKKGHYRVDAVRRSGEHGTERWQAG